MNYSVNSNLKNTISNFPWDKVIKNPLKPTADTIIVITTEVFNRVVAASQIRPIMEKVAGRSFSLAEICYFVVQDLDKKRSTSLTALAQIQEASSDENQISLAQHAFTNLSAMFVQITSADLKEITLLFGIHKIADIAKNSLPAPESGMEDGLAKLVELRSKRNINNVPDEQKEFLKNVDAKIKENNLS